VAGVILFGVPYYATDLFSRRFGRIPDVHATAKLFIGAACYTTWLALLVAAIWVTAGAKAAAVGLALLPGIAVASLFAIEHETAVADAIRAWLVLRSIRGETRVRLRRRRSEIAELLDEVYRSIAGV
jgi:uncharacterized PurR-regulated membrane protein YhhQ (DUF165 family)